MRPYVDERITDRSAADRAAHVAADAWGFHPPRFLRHGMNVIYVSSGATGESVSLRVARPTARAEVSLELADLLLSRAVPVAEPVRDDVVRAEGLSVTAWRHLEAAGAVDWAAVGAAVRRLHGLAPDDLPPGVPTPSPVDFPWWDFAAMLADVGEAIDDGARRGIVASLERYGDWSTFPASAAVVCHGDVHPGNVVQTTEGPMLIDWDLLCLAPRAWDHAPLMPWTERWGGADGVYAALSSGYGWSARGDRWGEAFAELRLVAATLMRVKAGLADPAAMPQARERLRYWRGEADAPVWRAV